MNRPFALYITFCLSLTACGSDDASKSGAKTIEISPRTKYVREGEMLIQQSDSNGDGKPDVFKHFLNFPDPDNPAVTKQRLVKLMLDVDFNGKLDVTREYNDQGQRKLERSDTDLDGTVDVITYYDKGKLSKKELFDPDKKLVATRFYLGGTLLRVERDTTGDGKVDYWEYYEQGILDRIGRDFNADGAADSWQRR